MRPAPLLALLLLASCAGGRPATLSDRAPGMDIADAALANGAPDTALHIAQRALATDPDNVPALIRAGNAQAALGQHDQAARTFSRAVTLAPGNTDAALGLGRVKLASDPAGAVPLLKRVSEQDPRNVAALVDLGVAMDLQGQHANAQQSYRRALAIDPERLAANVNLGLSLALSGSPQQAVVILQPLGSGSNAPRRVRQDLAVALALAGDNTSAASLLQKDIGASEASATLAAYQMLRSTP